jgi:hypothetical protein
MTASLRRRLPRVAAFAFLVTLAAPSQAVEGVFFIHVTPASFSGCGAVDASSLSCRDIVSASDSVVDDFAWIVIGDLSGEIGGAQFGISYDSGVNVATEAWTLCTGGSQISEPGWPNSDTGQAITWAGGCAQTGSDDLAVVGFLYVRSRSSGRIRVIEDPRVGFIGTTSCPPAESFDGCEYNGSASFGGQNGYVPENCRCAGPPVETGTWTSIKSRYGN